ncbi:MAG TPA: sigma-70 family RNA polymerase sigma factor [Candidatus Acidoferrales bacterium]|nr:sigma-70 family RNA polymerase sigma factor [Candidatus Acidoferrales bacterium]
MSGTLVIPLGTARSGTQASGEFAELALPLFDSLYNFACWLAKDRADAEDLVQETYAKALNGFSSFQQGTNFRAWMFRILRNTFLNSRTGLAVTRTTALEDEEHEGVDAFRASQETPETILLHQTNQLMIQEAIEQLPLAFREVVLLCDVEEMSYQEIAETLGIPMGTVMSRLARARRALREALKDKLVIVQAGA